MTAQTFYTTVETRLNQGKNPEHRHHYYSWLFAAVQCWQPMCIVELGTHRGGSFRHLYNASMNYPTKLITIDTDNPDEYILPHEKQDARVTVLHGDDTDSKIVEQVPSSIDFLFVDTIHNSQHVLAEWNAYASKLAPYALVVFDDIYAIPDAWNTIKGLPGVDAMDISQYHTTQGFGFAIVSRQEYANNNTA